MSDVTTTDVGSAVKERVKALIKAHPVQFVMYCIGILWVTILLTVLLLRTEQTITIQDQTRQALCGGTFENTDAEARKVNCQLLITRMIKYATPEQIQQIKGMVNGK